MYQLVLCTCPNEATANKIAACLVEEKLAACVNVIPKIRSYYQWQGKVECEEEVQLIIKTIKDKFGCLSDRIIELHPYDIPEVIAMNVQQGDLKYLNWITESLK